MNFPFEWYSEDIDQWPLLDNDIMISYSLRIWSSNITGACLFCHANYVHTPELNLNMVCIPLKYWQAWTTLSSIRGKVSLKFWFRIISSLIITPLSSEKIWVVHLTWLRLWTCPGITSQVATIEEYLLLFLLLRALYSFFLRVKSKWCRRTYHVPREELQLFGNLTFFFLHLPIFIWFLTWEDVKCYQAKLWLN
jgi:hypothetical protein